MVSPRATRAPNLRHLFALAAIARQGSIGQAARSIHLSQPAVTHAVAAQEEALGVKLFERSRKGMVPTEAGRHFATRIDRAFDWLRIGERAFRGTPALHRLATTVQLRMLSAALEFRGFSVAARELGVAQQTVHRAVSELEAICGQPLFRRGALGLEPTAEARVLARAAGLAFAEITQGMNEAREHAGYMDGRIAVGCLPLARTHLLPSCITRLLARFPDARVQIMDGPFAELLHGLRHGTLDLIIGALRDPSPAPDVRQEPCFWEPLSLVVRAGHPLLTDSSFTIRKLAAMDWIVPREGTPARHHFDEFLQDNGLPAPRHVIECSSLAATRGLLLQSDRAALLSVSQIRYELLAGQLAVLPQSLPRSSRPIGITMRDNWKPTRLQAAFIALIREITGDMERTAAGPPRESS